LKFFDLVEEVKERHRFARVMAEEEEEDGRKRMEDEVVKLVVPALRSFIQKHREKEFSKSECFCVVVSLPCRD
jgi:exocyst complex protein 7